jgi:hypothetical protein
MCNSLGLTVCVFCSLCVTLREWSRHPQNMHIHTVLAHLGQMKGLGYDGGERFVADKKSTLNIYESMSIDAVMYVCMHL